MLNWRPDWRDESAYPLRLTETQWRWEFLRRCEDYQEDFSQHNPQFFEEGMKQVERYSFEPPGGWETFFRGMAVMPGSHEKYGVTVLVDPAKPEPPLGLFVAECPYVVNFASAQKQKEMTSDGLALIAFDLKRPLKPQLEKAQVHLMSLQTESLGKPRERRNHRAKWARYLRVIDARATGAEFKEIARVLGLKPTNRAEGFDPERLVSETLMQARTVQLRFKQAD